MSIHIDLHALRMKIKFRHVFIFITLVLYIFSIVFTAVGTFSTNYRIDRVSFDTSYSYYKAIQNRNLTFDNVSILPDDLAIIPVSGYMITPTHPKVYPMPGIVWEHGMIVNSEIQLHNAIEYAAAGFKVLAIDLPGHGGTGGLWDFGLEELQVMYSAVDYLSNQTDVDPNLIAVSGHSNGGIAATRAGIFDKTPFGTGGKIKAVAAVFCIDNLSDTLQSIIGTNVVDDPDWGVMISEYAGCPNGIVTDSDVATRSITNFINSTNIPNYCLFTGNKDELTNTTIQFNIFQQATGGLYTVPQLTTIESQTPTFSVNNTDQPNVSYQNGTARKLVIMDGQDHVAEVMTPSNWDILIDWMVKSLGLNSADFVSRLDQGMPVEFYYYARFIGWITLLIATTMFVIILGTKYSKRFFPRKPHPPPKLIPTGPNVIGDLNLGNTIWGDADVKVSYVENFSKFIKTWKKKLGYVLLLIAVIVLGMLISWQINLYFLPFWILDQYLIQYFWAGLLLFILGWVMYFLYRRGDKNVRMINYNLIGLDWQGFKRSIPFLLIVLGLPLLIYNGIAYFEDIPLFFPRPVSLQLYGYVFIAFLMIFLFYLSFEVFSKTQLFERPYDYPNAKGYIKEILINGTITFGILIIAYIIGGLGMNNNLKWLMEQNNNGTAIMLIVNGIILLIQGFMAYLSAYFYGRTKNIFTVALIEALMATFIITGKLCFIYAVF